MNAFGLVLGTFVVQLDSTSMLAKSAKILPTTPPTSHLVTNPLSTMLRMFFSFSKPMTSKGQPYAMVGVLGVVIFGWLDGSICIFTSMPFFYVNVDIMSVCILRQSHYCCSMRP